ncbi:MAG: hypothetical protein LE169_05415 [Endomicrobium sp.]|nr:hypothetical protein [Endomicrobium sp.]
MNKEIKHACFNRIVKCTLAVIIILAAVFICMCFFGHKELLKSFVVELLYLTDNLILPKQVSQDAFLSTITNFYTTIITVLIVMVGLISSLGLLYVRNVSKRDIEREIRESLKEEFFKSYLSEMVRKTVDENLDIADITEACGNLSEQVDSLKKRIEFLEKLASAKASDTLYRGNTSNGSNKKDIETNDEKR